MPRFCPFESSFPVSANHVELSIAKLNSSRLILNTFILQRLLLRKHAGAYTFMAELGGIPDQNLKTSPPSTDNGFMTGVERERDLHFWYSTSDCQTGDPEPRTCRCLRADNGPPAAQWLVGKISKVDRSTTHHLPIKGTESFLIGRTSDYEEQRGVKSSHDNSCFTCGEDSLSLS